MLEIGSVMLTLVEMQIGGSNAFPSLSSKGSSSQSTPDIDPESSGMKTLSDQVVSGVEEPPQFDKKLEIEPSISDRSDS